MAAAPTSRREFITGGRFDGSDPAIAPGVALRTFATGRMGSTGLSTGIAGDEPDRVLVDPGYCDGRLGGPVP